MNMDRRGVSGLVLGLVLFSGICDGQAKYVPEEGSAELKEKRKRRETVETDPRLPNVLIIGDSISLGYTPRVRELLQGKANVIHAPGNNQGTTLGREKLGEWLGDTKWAVIHFN